MIMVLQNLQLLHKILSYLYAQYVLIIFSFIRHLECLLR